MKKFITKIDVLGVTYRVYTDRSEDDKYLRNCDGYNQPERKVIVLDVNNKPVHQVHVLRHELVHAFLHECGLDSETWATNEEIVDWIALQLYKVNKLLKEGDKVLYAREREQRISNKSK